ncbi:MAG: type II secretion system protein [Candidatus Gastranaerophilales bacterium]|nr:type II secretion system protein [Candidatus Gastranaerophilales bacterium]
MQFIIPTQYNPVTTRSFTAFTLAEVLITLVIIGIIAAMTIPSLLNKTNEQETITAVKKAYSTLSRAHGLVLSQDSFDIADYGGYYDATMAYAGYITQYLNINKKCGRMNEYNSGCFPSVTYKNLDGSSGSTFGGTYFYTLQLTDGMSLAINLLASSYLSFPAFGTITVDINGDKYPNTFGKDLFSFIIHKDSIVPDGMPNYKYPEYSFNRDPSLCHTKGTGCTAWVIMKGNLDYLRKDVSL